jgi:hypothetical protein
MGKISAIKVMYDKEGHKKKTSYIHQASLMKSKNNAQYIQQIVQD